MLKSLIETAKSMGLVVALFYYFNRILEKISGENVTVNLYYIFGQPVKPPQAALKRRAKKITLRLYDEYDPILETFPRPAQEIRNRFESGAVCFTAVKNEKLVGFLWIVIGPYSEFEDRTTFSPLPENKMSWDFDLYVTPEERLGFTFVLLWNEANEYLTKKGISKTFSRVSAYNPDSIRSHQRMGAENVMSLLYFKMFSSQMLLTAQPPFIRFSLSGHSVPTVDVYGD